MVAVDGASALANSEHIWPIAVDGPPVWTWLLAVVLSTASTLQLLCTLRFWLDKKLLMQREHITNRVREAAGIAWIVYNVPKQTWEASGHFSRLIDLDGERPRSDHLAQLMQSRALAQIRSTYLKHCRDTRAYTIEFEIALADGQQRLLRAVACNDFLPDHSISTVSAVVKDVTEERARVATIERERKRALEEAREARLLANTDPLTGLPNRRSLMSEMDRFIIAARESRSPLSLVIFDIDRFKAVNDRFGHQAGDAVLRRVADIASEQVRHGDLVGRIGGEEFAWLLRGGGSQQVAQAAERLRWAIEMRSATSDVAAVTISAGYAHLEQGDTSLTLFANADAALYEAKRAGRNRILEAA